MRIILFSDVHANLPALEAFLKELDQKKPDAIYCLGDLVGYNVWPNEVIAEIRQRSISTIAGNHDLKINNLSSDTSGKNYAYHIIDEEGRAYLKSLPLHIRLEFKWNGNSLNILLVHGSPRSIDEYVLENLEEAYVLNLMNEANADILFCGHSHKPYHRIIKTSFNGNSVNKHIVNTGSVGKPKDGDPRGGYVVLTLNDSSLQNGFQIDFERFDYDVEKAAKAVEESPLPDEFADCLRSAH